MFLLRRMSVLEMCLLAFFEENSERNKHRRKLDVIRCNILISQKKALGSVQMSCFCFAELNSRIEFDEIKLSY